MKQLSKQKWILSSLLIAALGSQYYFSTTSQETGQFELSQLAAPADQSVSDLTAALQAATQRPAHINYYGQTGAAQTPVPADQAKPAAAPAAAVVTATVATAETCQDCVTLTKAQAERLRQILAEVAKPKSTALPGETPLEKMRREREEREEARKEAQLIKEEKAREAKLTKEEKKKFDQEMRDEKFKDDFERLASRCSDVECYSSSFALALNRYTSGDRRISPSVLNSIFNQYIAKDLKEGLKDPTNEKALEALKTLMSEIPNEYKSFKNKSIDIAKSIAAPMATEANNKFKQAEQLRKANKLNESNQAFTQAMEQKTELERTLNAHYEAVKDGTDKGDDKATYSYYNQNYAKPASQWLSNIMSSTGFNVEMNPAGNGTVSADPVFGSPQQPQTSQQPTRGIVRGGNGNPLVDNRMGMPQQQNLGAPPQQQGTQIGTRGNR